MQRQTVFPFIKNNFYIFAVLAYCSVLTYNYIRADVLFQFMEGLLALGTIPVVLYVLHKVQSSQGQLFLRQWIPFIIVLLSYEALQGTAGLAVNSSRVLKLYPYDEMLWGMNVDATIQQAFLHGSLLPFQAFATEASVFFYTLHFYLVIIASVVLWLFRRSLFGKYAISMVITSYVALLIFALVPTAPPWYSGIAQNLLVSATTLKSTPPILAQFSHFSSLIESDKFAAFPSLHAAYATLFCVYMVRFRKKLIALMIPLEFGVLFATLYLGQHYLIDLIAGVSLALASVVLADYISKRFAPNFAMAGSAFELPIARNSQT